MKFSEIYIGQKAEIKHKITEEDIEKFVDLTGDDNRLHVDKEYAGNTSFKKPVAHGMLGASFISTIIGTKLPGDGALWFAQNLEFLLPVRINDVISVEAEVVNTLKRQNIIELRTDVFNQNKQKVIAGSAKVKIVEQKIEQIQETIQKPLKNALIIGASGGIGTEIARDLAKDGYDICLHFHSNNEKIEKLKTEMIGFGRKVYTVKADLTNQNEIKQLFNDVNRKFEYISVVVFAATVPVPNISFDKLEWNDFENHININVKSIFYLVKEFKQKFKNQKYGRILGITTQYSESTPPKDLMPYVTAKSAMNGLFKSLAIEFAPFNVTVNLVSPAITNTDLISNIPEKTKLLFAAQTPLKRIALAKDVSNAVKFLVSEDAGFITGQTIRVNGGMNML